MSARLVCPVCGAAAALAHWWIDETHARCPKCGALVDVVDVDVTHW